MPPRTRTVPEKARIDVGPQATRALRRGHPWIWRSAVRKAPADLACGTPVSIGTPGQPPIARGLWDPNSPIAVRVYTTDLSQQLDEHALARAVIRSIELRDRMFDLRETNAFRMCNGEGDRCPGVVIDRFGTVAVARFDGEAIRVWAEPLLREVWVALQERGVRSLVLRNVPGERDTVQVVAGKQTSRSVIAIEHGMRMSVDLARGQKTGAFLDQRENRARVRSLGAGANVLDLFSHTGGFACAAALGGASHVALVDIAEGALASAQETFRLNGLDSSPHAFVTADAFSFLDRARQQQERYDLIVSDPPSFAPSERSAPRAVKAYRRLHRMCASLVAPGGVLCASSCSSHVTLDDFLGTLDDETLGSGRFVVDEVFGQPCDHPTLPSWPEGRYLKFVVLRRR